MTECKYEFKFYVDAKGEELCIVTAKNKYWYLRWYVLYLPSIETFVSISGTNRLELFYKDRNDIVHIVSGNVLGLILPFIQYKRLHITDVAQRIAHVIYSYHDRVCRFEEDLSLLFSKYSEERVVYNNLEMILDRCLYRIPYDTYKISTKAYEVEYG